MTKAPTGTELPTLPAVVTLIIRAANDPRISLADLARLIEREPGMTVSLLKLANSAAFSPGRGIKTVEQATILLGSRMVRNITVAHATTTLKAPVDLGRFDGAAFWEDSLRRACAAHVLARHLGYEDPSEAFTVGLIQDLGVLSLAVQGHGDRMEAMRSAPAEVRRRAEVEVSGKDHAEHFIALGRHWGLPRDLVEAVSLHHDDFPRSHDARTQRLARIAQVADAIADVTQTHAAGDTMLHARGAFDALLFESGARAAGKLELERVVTETAAEMVAQGKDLDIRVGPQPTFEALVELASRTLVRVSLTYEELSRQLEATARERDELSRALAASAAEAHRFETIDTLTGVANRRAFEVTLGQRLQSAAGRPTSLIALRVDGLAAINEAHGHPIGDEVLAETAKRLVGALRLTDVVGRLGSSELAVMLPDCDRSDGLAVAERLRRAVYREPIACRDGVELGVTATLGGVATLDEASADVLMRVAAATLRESRRAGRDRVAWAD